MLNHLTHRLVDSNRWETLTERAEERKSTIMGTVLLDIQFVILMIIISEYKM
jgi:hypothetical protein